MRRDLRRLADDAFDLLIIGAGVYGAAMAWDAAQRGLAVALVDRGDIGAGTSFNNAKTVHGGVRSLQHGLWREMREYLRERRALARIAPHLVHPLPFLLPTYGGLGRAPITQQRLPLRAYFALYDLLAADRNAGVDPARHLPRAHAISREECLRRHPALAVDEAPADLEGGGLPASIAGTATGATATGGTAENLHGRITGGIVWHDCQMYSGDRMTLAFALSAARAGAAVANHVEATALRRDGDRVIGATLRDGLTGDAFDVRAAVTVNAAGPWAGDLLASLPPARAVPPVVPALSLAMNLVTRPIARDCAVAGSAQGRLFFLAPWRDVTIGGTSHDPFTGTASGLRATRADVTRLLDDLNTAFPGAKLTLDDVRLVHRGLLPAEEASGTRVTLLKHSRIRDHREDGWRGLMSVVGVRYTTARHTAQLATDLAFRLLDRSAPPCRTDTTPLMGGDIGDYATFMRDATSGAAPASGSAAAAERLARLYGTEHVRVRRLAEECPALGEPLSPDVATRGAEVLFAVREEMAVRLTDALLRRTDTGSAGHPGAAAIETAARLMGDELGWSAERRQAEIASVERTYVIEE